MAERGAVGGSGDRAPAGSARDRIYAEIRRRLTSGTYGPGDSLIPAALSVEFDVSRTPVREALALLERDGLLTITSRGYLPRIRSEQETLDVFEVREILETAAAKAAAQRRSETDLARLTEATSRAAASADPTEKRLLFNDFHTILRHAARNPTLTELLQGLEAIAKVCAPWRESTTQRESSTGRESPNGPGPSEGGSRPFVDRQSEHEDILAAIVDGDADRAESLMREHLLRDRQLRVGGRTGGPDRQPAPTRGGRQSAVSEPVPTGVGGHSSRVSPI
ncbi:GntR family transcriptional regulator [Millisia brevis]|uniref:GntR family transcriptional regulator n=1 Tax=Millisia brevis TaxID=264148 RepID=UPI0009FFD452|nr:GntR family transcriptional regulator [Millisia brevis]